VLKQEISLDYRRDTDTESSSLLLETEVCLASLDKERRGNVVAMGLGLGGCNLIKLYLSESGFARSLSNIRVFDRRIYDLRTFDRRAFDLRAFDRRIVDLRVLG